MVFTIKTPCSSANIGPGFDVLGLALSIYLEVRVTITASQTSSSPLNCVITSEDQSGTTIESISHDPEINLITRVALYVLRCHGRRSFPNETHVHIVNSIPLGRGLGSSGAAVVAGCLLGNEVGRLGLSKARLFDYCLMIERHPDNVAAALFGGFVATYSRELSAEDLARKEIPLSEILPAPAGGLDTGFKPPEPPIGIGHYMQFPLAPEIKAIVVIPDFEVPTSKARDVLPQTYSRADVIHNLQRTTLLPHSLGQSPPDPETIFLAMQDKIHQPYRHPLIPGLSTILRSINPGTQPGLLGICLSGAGPTVLALATERFGEIAETIVKNFEDQRVRCLWKVLNVSEGALVLSDGT